MDATLIALLVLAVCGALVGWLILRRQEALATELERLDELDDLYQRVDDLAELIEQRRLGEQLQTKLTEFTEGMARLASQVAEVAEQQQRLVRGAVELAGQAAEVDLAGLVRRHLGAQGFESVKVLSESGEPGADSGRVVFEARRRGVMHKGHAVVQDGEVVDTTLRSAYSTFP